MNVFNSLRVILDNSDFVLECLEDHTSKSKAKDLVEMLESAIRFNNEKRKPDLKIKVGCHHIIKLLQGLSVDGNLDA